MIPLISGQNGKELSEIYPILSWIGANIASSAPIDGIDRDFDRDFLFWQKLAPSLLGGAAPLLAPTVHPFASRLGAPHWSRALPLQRWVIIIYIYNSGPSRVSRKGFFTLTPGWGAGWKSLFAHATGEYLFNIAYTSYTNVN